MKIIICGAGQVGGNLARYLATEDNDVTIIDIDLELISKISDSLDVQGIVGFASYPDILHQAGAQEADMIIAVTRSDEVNMLACQVAHSNFNVPMKIARIRNKSYLDPRWAGLYHTQHLPIDVKISPEVEVAVSIERNLKYPGAFTVMSVANGLVQIIGVRCLPKCPILNTPLKHLHTIFPALDVSIAAIIRGDELIIPSAEDVLLEGDEVYFIVSCQHAHDAMTAFGFVQDQSSHIVVIGGGNIALSLIERLIASPIEVDLRVIENDKARASFIARQLPEVIVLNGNALDQDILNEASIKDADTVITVTNDDKVNILASLLAKESGAKRTFALVNKSEYNSLVTPLKIDSIVSPRAVTVSTILQHIRKGRVKSVLPLKDHLGEIIDIEVLGSSDMVGRSVRMLEEKKALLFGAVVRDGSVLIADPKLVIQANDRVILAAIPEQIRKVERMFSARLRSI